MRIRFRLTGLLILAIPISATALAGDGAPATDLRETVTVVGTSPYPSSSWYSPAIVNCSDDQTHLAILTGTPETLWIDGKVGPGFDEIVAGEALEVPKCIWGGSGRYAYAGRRGDEQFLVVDGVESGPYAEVHLGSFRWDPTGKRFACVVVKGDSFRVWMAGKEGPPFEAIWSYTLTFGADGSSLAYVAVRAGRAVLVVDGVVKESAGSVDASTLKSVAVSADLAHFAALATTSAGAVCFVDGVASRPYAKVAFLDAVPRGSGFSFTAEDLGEPKTSDGRPAREWHRWVIAGVEMPNAQSVSFPTFSADGRRFAYVSKEVGAPPVVMVDGKPLVVEGATLDSVAFDSLVFSPDGRRLAFRGEGGGSRVVVDGRASPPVEGTRVDSLTFSPDSAHLSYRAVQKSLPGAYQVATIFIDGRPRLTTTNGWAWPRAFSPDGTTFVHENRTPDGRFRIEMVAVTGTAAARASTVFDAILSPTVRFTADGAAHVLAVRGKEIVRVEVR